MEHRDFEEGGEIRVYHYIPRLIAGALSGALTGIFALGNVTADSCLFVNSGCWNLATLYLVLKVCLQINPEEKTQWSNGNSKLWKFLDWIFGIIGKLFMVENFFFFFNLLDDNMIRGLELKNGSSQED